MVPVSDVRSAQYTAAEGGEGLQTHTHSIGVIVPPPDIKAIADKTAQFVARNGEFGLADVVFQATVLVHALPVHHKTQEVDHVLTLLL